MWHNFVNKYGYDVKIVNWFDRYEDALEHEKDLIKTFGRINLSTGQLVNLTDGGEGSTNLKHTEETKRKMSISKKGKQPKNNVAGWNKKTIVIRGIKYPSITAASKTLKESLGAIHNRLNDETKTEYYYG